MAVAAFKPCCAAKRQQTGRAAPNPKRVYRVMKIHDLLLQPHSGKGEEGATMVGSP